MAQKFSVSLLALVFLGLIGLYGRFLSPLMGNQCRFSPSCSHYAEDSIRKYGAVKGIWLAIQRVARCHPGSKGGIDPVP